MMPESHNIEYKSSWRDEYLKWISGFANAEGGTLFIGKNDDGEVIGLPEAKKLMEDLPNKVRDILGILVAINLRTSPQGEFIEIVVEEHSYPVNYKGQFYLRRGSTNQELKNITLNQFLLKKRGLRWDSIPVLHERHH